MKRVFYFILGAVGLIICAQALPPSGGGTSYTLPSAASFSNGIDSKDGGTFTGNVAVTGAVTASKGLASADGGTISGPMFNPGYTLTKRAGTGITWDTAAPDKVPIRTINKVTLDYTAFQAAATTKDVYVADMPTFSRLVGFWAKVNTNFTGGAISSCILTADYSGAGGTTWMTGVEAVSGAPKWNGTWNTTVGSHLNSTGGQYAQGGRFIDCSIYPGPNCAVYVRATSVGANLSALTAGSVDVYIELEHYY